MTLSLSTALETVGGRMRRRNTRQLLVLVCVSVLIPFERFTVTDGLLTMMFLAISEIIIILARIHDRLLVSRQ